jgi:lipoprotein signal peptidase
MLYPHLAAQSIQAFHGGRTIHSILTPALPLIFLGIGGAAFSIFKRNWLSLYPVAWALISYIIFRVHAPVFYHHQLMVTLPLLVLAAGGLGEGIQDLLSVRRIPDFFQVKRLPGVVAILCFTLVFLHYFPALDKSLANHSCLHRTKLKATQAELNILAAMQEYKGRTNWIMTDMPIFAFRTQRPVPPAMATFSMKRLATGSLTTTAILDAMRQYRPELTLIGRFQNPSLKRYLESDYKLILSQDALQLYLRSDVASDTASDSSPKPAVALPVP